MSGKLADRRAPSTGFCATYAKEPPQPAPRCPAATNSQRAPMKTLILIATLMTLTACETMQGLGRDVENTGETLQQESVEAQQNP